MFAVILLYFLLEFQFASSLSLFADSFIVQYHTEQQSVFWQLSSRGSQKLTCFLSTTVFWMSAKAAMVFEMLVMLSLAFNIHEGIMGAEKIAT